MNSSRAVSARIRSNVSQGENTMADDANKVWPSGLTTAEAEELQRGLVDGTRTFGFLALLAHFLSYAYTPWLH
jgi:light-harvesting protein B-800-850 beta chain